jgi:hypothetical protein
MAVIGTPVDMPPVLVELWKGRDIPSSVQRTVRTVKVLGSIRQSE